MDSATVKDDFLIQLKFQNNLPNAPSGPFLKNISILQSFDEFPEFRTSTLEKGYVWQPHFGLDMGIKLDLVDQEAILAQDKGSQQLDQSDLRYLTGTVEKGRGKAKQIDQSSKPWWLRNTTYMENNLYNVARVKVKTAEAKREVSAKRQAIDYNLDMFSTEFINDSFDQVSKTIEKLIAKNANGKLVREMPVVPLGGDVLSRGLHSLVRFDEDPTVAVSNGSSASEEGYSSSSSSAPNAKRRKVDQGLITNLRQMVKSEDLKNQVSEVSLVSPLVVPAASKSDQQQADQEAGQVVYSWVKDYRMDVQQIQDSFLFVFSDNSNSNSTTNGTNGANGASSSSSTNNHSSGGMEEVVQYFPVRTRVDMKKMNPEDSLPHDCIVLKE